MAKQKVQLMFNRLTGAFLGLAGHGGDREVVAPPADSPIVFKEVEMDRENEIWEGSMDAGRLIPISERKPVITEFMVNSGAKDKIQRKYPIHAQVNILVKMVELLLEKVDMTEEEIQEFRDMVEYINHVRANNSRYKDAYKANPNYDYVSAGEYIDRLNDELEGGLQEVVGRPPRKVDTPWDNN